MNIKASDYRPDIDGLRAISVLLVVFYHLGVSFAQAGFIGVDVFFVISGFLITKHILFDYEKGTFRLSQFYLRRMRRILPAVLTVLVVTTIISFYVFLPNDLLNYTKSMLATLLSVSNLYFFKTIHLGYFSTDAKVFPLLHTWTLGVEEQFYIVWPLVLLVMLKRLSVRGVFVLSSILCFCSFVIYYVYHWHHVLAVFYLPITRGFELLLGVLLAIIWKRQIQCSSKLFNDIISIIGLGLIIYAGCFLKADDYPGVFILFPCIGAVMLIYSGREDGIVNRLLSLKLIVFIGLVSYSLYLWHWPFIAFTNYFNVPITASIAAGILFLSFGLSIITWGCVEQPFRFKFKFGLLKTFSFFIVIPVLIVAAILFFLKKHPEFSFNTISTKAYKIANNKDLTGGCPMDTGALTPSINTHCWVGDQKAKRTSVLIVGDSHTMAITGMMQVLLSDAGLKGRLVAQSGTPFILGKIPNWRKNQPMIRNEFIKKLLDNNHYKFVVMAGYWNYYPDWALTGNMKEMGTGHFSIFKNGLEKAVKEIIAHHSIPVIVYDVPPLLNVSKYCGFTRLSKFNRCYNDRREIDSVQKNTINILSYLRAKYPAVIFIDPKWVICEGAKCYSSFGSIPLYSSGHQNSHLNVVGSALLGRKYLKKAGNPFSSIR